MSGEAAPAPAAEGKRIFRTGRASVGPEITAVLTGGPPGGGEAGGGGALASGGEEGTEVSAATLPCAGCHGRDGHGRPEGGVVPPDITWDVLTRPYGAAGGGRRHPPYDARSLKRAITLGIDAGGNPLQAAMPRYRLTQAQAAALIAYIQVLGRESDPGVDASAVRVGVLLPPGPEAAAVRADLDAYAARLGRAGGIYGRRLDLHYLAPARQGVPDGSAPLEGSAPPERSAPAGSAPPEGSAPAAGSAPPDTAAPPAAWRREVERFVAGERLFALAASSFAGAERELAEMAADLDLPVVGALTAAPWQESGGGEAGRYVFYLQSGLADQARALVQVALAAPPVPAAPAVRAASPAAGREGGRLGLLVPGAAPAAVAAAAEAARDECARLGVEPWTATWEPGGADLEAKIDAARQAGVASIVFLGSEEPARRVLERAGGAEWRPRVYLLGELAAGALAGLPADYAGHVYLAAPSLATDLAPRGEELLRLAAAGAGAGGKVPAGRAAGMPAAAVSAPAQPEGPPSPYRRAALAAVEALREALTRAGRGLDRDRLVDTLEGLRDFQTGLWPPLTFGPQRRVGALGAYVVAYDPRRRSLAQVGGWITPR